MSFSGEAGMLPWDMGFPDGLGDTGGLLDRAANFANMGSACLLSEFWDSSGQI